MLTLVSSTLRPRTRGRRVPLWIVSAAAIVVMATVVTAVIIASRASPQVEPAWPASGSAAIAWGEGSYSSPGSEEPAQIGSVAKLITALVALDRIPLAEGDAGPTFVLTDDDVAFSKTDPGATDRLIPVAAGETISLRTLLDYTLIASSNTHARALAPRIFGSEAEYLAAARTWLDDHELNAIAIGDATGISPQNMSTPTALVKLGLIADENALIRSIAAMPSTITPDGGLIDTTNTLLGTQGIDGLKTGHPTNGEYTMIFSATIDDDRVVGAIVGSPSDSQRSTDVIRLLAQRSAFAD